jgi:two-component system chemotaxis response regulator CheY
MKIMIAEDDAAMRRLLTMALRGLGHAVQEAGDGLAAWEHWQREGHSLVITDWNMPGLDGPELIQRIRARRADNYTYIILLTSRDNKVDVVAGLEAGADDYLTKPFDPHELRARLGVGERIRSLESRLKLALERQEELASHDSLTNLSNRRALYEQAEAELARMRREGKAVGLVLADLDHFKAVNDTRGHLVGDQALRFVADRLTQVKRPYDLVGRWGGEEFLLVLPGAGLADTCSVAERLRSDVAGTSFVAQDGTELELSISAGVTSTSVHAESVTLASLLQQAEEMLYRAKRDGRNRVCAPGR